MTKPLVVRKGWRMVAPGTLEQFEAPLDLPPPGWVSIEVLGCGACHTDITYLYGGVAPVMGFPVVLGHEIVGRVLDSGQLVIVPAVSPCGACRACKRGRATACRASKMPGNHHDGGFASHVNVPERWLCEVQSVPLGLEPWQLAVVADAVTTPYQAIARSGLGPEDVAIVVGAGGVGGFLVELAAVRGAFPIAIDVSPARLEHALSHGAKHALDARGLDAKSAKREIAAKLASRGMEPEGWHVFECSGTTSGQSMAFGLLTRGGTLSVVGFSPETLPIRLSNLMALDADAHGNWGCDPVHYPKVLELVTAGLIDLSSAVERFPLSEAPAVLAAASRHELTRRPVLVPDA
ncbi:MAG: 6-hydroxycyclohex-1-ene-1-carbonyl-CoA dehydrogenase [Deltaproteobacteria bacterium]|nr:6-hydroxycyclohex-1-ene-1-carbonyl-CoA dehydrogenase [Deltaproteobacteria bacterium]